jgi:Fe-S-cluster containining protein
MNIQACSTCTNICCKRTTYKLTNEDIYRIAEVVDTTNIFNTGTKLSDILIHNLDGTIQLKAPCFFYLYRNCSIYEYRPVGCRIYPVVYNNGASTDPSCPGHNEIQHPERYSIILEAYMHTIQTEAHQRTRTSVSDSQIIR